MRGFIKKKLRLFSNKAFQEDHSVLEITYKKLEPKLITRILKFSKLGRHAMKIFNNFYLPSVGQFALIFILLLAIHLLHGIFDTEGVYNPDDIINISIGIGAITIGLIIFVAESARDGGKLDAGMVYSDRSLIFSLVVFQIGILYIFIFGYPGKFTPYPVLLLALFTIISTARTLRTTLVPNIFLQTRIKLYIKKFRNFLEQASVERMATTVFSQEKEKMKIKASFGWVGREGESFLVESKRAGFLSDINLQVLKQISDELSPLKSAKKKTPPSYSSAVSEKDLFYFCFYSIGQKIEKYGTLIFMKYKLSKKKAEKITYLANKAFIISRRPLFEEDEFTGIFKQFVSNFLEQISKKEFREIDNLRSIYEEIIKSFVKYLKKDEPQEGGYDKEQAMQEGSNFITDSWGGIVNDIFRGLNEIYITAMRSNDQKIVRAIASFPFELAIYSVKEGDFLIFWKSINLNYQLYRSIFSSKDEAEDITEYKFYRSWKWLQEITDYYIMPRLKDNHSNTEFYRRYKDMAVQVFVVFKLLLEEAAIKNREDHFSEFVSTYTKLFRHYLRPLYEREKISVEDIKKMQNEIQSRKEEMLFGVGSWIIYLLRRDGKTQQEESRYRKFLNTILSAFGDRNMNFSFNLRGIINLYIKASQDAVHTFWDWDRWSVKPDGEAHQVMTQVYIDYFFIYFLSNLIKSPDQIEVFNMSEVSDNWQIFDSKISELRQRINQYNDEFPFLDQQFNKELILSFLAKIETLWNDYLINKKKNMAISTKRVEEFESGFFKEYREDLQNNFLLTELVEVQEIKNKPSNNVGINQIEDKEMFLENWHIGYSGFGESYARGMIKGKERMIWQEVTKRCEEIRIEKMRELMNSEYQIFATPDLVYEFFDKDPNFTPKYNEPHILGYYKENGSENIIYELEARDIDSQILFVRKGSIGSVKQYYINSPHALKFPASYVNIKILELFSVKNGESIEMKEFLASPPKWLRDIGEYDQQYEFLKTKIIIKIFDCFEYEGMVEGNIGFKIIFHNEEDEDK